MSINASPAYRRGRAGEVARVIVEMPKAEAEAIDAWGVPAGMPSRTATIRHLVRKGLEAIKTRPETGGAPAAGEVSQA